VQKVANVIQNIMKSQEMKYNVSQPVVDKKSNVMQSNTPEIEENFTSTELAKVLGVNYKHNQKMDNKRRNKGNQNSTRIFNTKRRST
jgi:hypothetical protein